MMTDRQFESVYGSYSPVFPDPITCLKEILSSTAIVFYNSLIPWNGVYNWLKSTWEWHYICSYFNFLDITYIIATALLFTVLRYISYKLLLERIPKWFALGDDESKKFPEAAFRTVSYAVLWFLSCRALFELNVFFVPLEAWVGWRPGMIVTGDIFWIYMLQLGFYIHMIYATTYIETVRKDYLVQMIHHFITIALLGYSYSLGFHKIGLFVLFIHDVGDIFLELAKCFNYFKTMNGIENKWSQICANISFAVFALEWILFRLYWFPVKLLYTTGCVSYEYYEEAPFFCPFNILLWSLYVLHIYWFYFIVMLIVKILAGHEISDNRDYEKKKEQ